MWCLMKNTHFYSFSSTFAQYFDTESILVVVVANFQLVLKKKLNTRKHCWPVLNFILSCTYTFKNLCLMNGLQMTIVLSCLHCVFFFLGKGRRLWERGVVHECWDCLPGHPQHPCHERQVKNDKYTKCISSLSKTHLLLLHAIVDQLGLLVLGSLIQY